MSWGKMVQECLKAQPKNCYSNGITSLVDCWIKCLEKQADCRQKYMSRWRVIISSKHIVMVRLPALTIADAALSLYHPLDIFSY
jgi:hypothetical protein